MNSISFVPTFPATRIALTVTILTSLCFSGATAEEERVDAANGVRPAEAKPGVPTGSSRPEEIPLKPIDEITVEGARTIPALRRELIRAEDRINEIFNQINDDDGYDIICRRETRIGSQIPHRVCKAQMFRDAAAEVTDGWADGGAFGAPILDEDKHLTILKEKMRRLAAENPALLAALKERLALQKAYELARDRPSD